jgi:hypothetical protein
MRRCPRFTVALGTAVATMLGLAGTAQAATVALWHMNETSGTVMHDSAGSNDGTLHDVALGKSGLSGTAYGFNGTSSYVSVPSSETLNPGKTGFSVRVSVRFSKLPAQDYDLLRKGLSTTAGGDYKMEIAHSGQALCLFGGSAGKVTLIGGPKLNTGTWHTIVCAKSATGVRLVVDGTVRKTSSVTVGSIANSASVYLGAKPGTDFYNGIMDEVRIAVG